MANENDFLTHVRETVTIMRPMPSVLPRGNASPRDQQPTRSLRLQPDVLEAIDDATKLLGMSRSAFMSWCAYNVALDIIRQHGEFMKKVQGK